MNVAYLLNLPTTTMMFSKPLNLGSATMKSIVTLSQGSSAMGRGSNKQGKFSHTEPIVLILFEGKCLIHTWVACP